MDSSKHNININIYDSDLDVAIYTVLIVYLFFGRDNFIQHRVLFILWNYENYYLLYNLDKAIK